MKRLSTFIFTLMLTFSGISLFAQKKITPVDSDPNKPAQPTLHYYDKHGNPLEEPVYFLSDLDTVKNVRPGPVYPLLYSANVGINFFDGIMMLAGQKHASFDLSASLSLHNWFEPVIECGIGFADNHPDDANYRYVGKPSFYGKIGINYNFLYKSNPDYQLFLGLRGGFTAFSYDIKDVTISSDYWGPPQHFSLAGQKSHALYGQVLLGLKVKLWRNISMGWSFRYGFKGKVKDASNSAPWFIPGYGTGPLNASFSLFYTIPINTKKIEDNILPVDLLPEDLPALPSNGISVSE